jgi:hypothetical protein
LGFRAAPGKYPQRVVAAVAEACGYDISNVDAALKVPMLHHNGIEDICYNNFTIVAKGRRKGALWAHAVNPVMASPTGSPTACSPVSTVNWSDVVGKKSASLTLKKGKIVVTGKKPDGGKPPHATL